MTDDLTDFDEFGSDDIDGEFVIGFRVTKTIEAESRSKAKSAAREFFANMSNDASLSNYNVEGPILERKF
jgi:hypothetical protein